MRLLRVEFVTGSVQHDPYGVSLFVSFRREGFERDFLGSCQTRKKVTIIEKFLGISYFDRLDPRRPVWRFFVYKFLKRGFRERIFRLVSNEREGMVTIIEKFVGINHFEC